jgi:hypothetical protein
MPENPVEAELAGQFVAASEQWKECLRVAKEPGASREWGAACRGQALGLMRQANGTLRLLQRIQEARRMADPATRDRRARTQQALTRVLVATLEAIRAEPDPPAAPAPTPAPAEADAHGTAGPAPETLPAAAAEAPRAAPPSASAQVPANGTEDTLAPALPGARPIMPGPGG